jgi:hypothetical protein
MDGRMEPFEIKRFIDDAVNKDNSSQGKLIKEQVETAINKGLDACYPGLICRQK